MRFLVNFEHVAKENQMSALQQTFSSLIKSIKFKNLKNLKSHVPTSATLEKKINLKKCG